MLAVLSAAASVVPERPVRQQQDQEDHVEVRRRSLKQRRNRPEERPGDLGEVVEVAGHSPPAGAQEERGGLLPAGVDVARRDVFRRLAPYDDVPLGL